MTGLPWFLIGLSSSINVLLEVAFLDQLFDVPHQYIIGLRIMATGSVILTAFRLVGSRDKRTTQWKLNETSVVYLSQNFPATGVQWGIVGDNVQVVGLVSAILCPTQHVLILVGHPRLFLSFMPFTASFPFPNLFNSDVVLGSRMYLTHVQRPYRFQRFPKVPGSKPLFKCQDRHTVVSSFSLPWPHQSVPNIVSIVRRSSP